MDRVTDYRWARDRNGLLWVDEYQGGLLSGPFRTREAAVNWYWAELDKELVTVPEREEYVLD